MGGGSVYTAGWVLTLSSFIARSSFFFLLGFGLVWFMVTDMFYDFLFSPFSTLK